MLTTRNIIRVLSVGVGVANAVFGAKIATKSPKLLDPIKGCPESSLHGLFNMALAPTLFIGAGLGISYGTVVSGGGAHFAYSALRNRPASAFGKGAVALGTIGLSLYGMYKLDKKRSAAKSKSIAQPTPFAAPKPN